MKTYKPTEDRIRQAKPQIETTADMDSRILRDACAAMPSGAQAERAGQPILRRIFMKPNVKFAAAAVILIAVLLSLTTLDMTHAYALEQTIEACRSLRFIHLKCEPAGNGVEEIWAQFDDKGQLEKLRMNFPNSDDGPKDVVWQEGKAEVWLKAKNISMVVKEQEMLERLKVSYADLDPKIFVEKLYEAQNSPGAQITIQQSGSADEPIVITSVANGTQHVYTVDARSKLLRRIDKYALQDGKAEWFASIEYLDYNQPDASVFELNLGADVVRFDQTDRAIGLEQGQMTAEEAAMETVRRFWQAIKDQEFDTAGQYIEGLPGPFVKQYVAEKMQIKVMEIISVGPVQPHSNPQTGGVIVPCTLKVEKNGQIEEMTFDRIGVRQVYNQPGRWTIFGGL